METKSLRTVSGFAQTSAKRLASEIINSLWFRPLFTRAVATELKTGPEAKRNVLARGRSHQLRKVTSSAFVFVLVYTKPFVPESSRIRHICEH